MFTWICPKCGNEVPPAYSDCPNCASAAKTEADAAAAAPEAAAAAPPQEAAPPRARAYAPAPPSSNRIYVPGWALSLLFAAVFAIVGLTIILVKRSDQSKAAPPAAQVQSQAATFENVAPSAAVQSDPILRNLEITGLRLTEDDKHKAFAQLVAINHTSADFGEVSAKVDVFAVTSKGGHDPVGTCTFKVPLAAYESKEVKVPFETKLRVYELPDWQFLRAEIAGR